MVCGTTTLGKVVCKLNPFQSPTENPKIRKEDYNPPLKTCCGIESDGELAQPEGVFFVDVVPGTK